jgi:hypothetical protein
MSNSMANHKNIENKSKYYKLNILRRNNKQKKKGI